MAIKIPQTLVDELTRLNVLSEEKLSPLKDAAQKENKDFGQILIEKKIISDPELLKIKSRLYRLPVVDLEGYEISKDVLKEFS